MKHDLMNLMRSELSSHSICLILNCYSLKNNLLPTIVFAGVIDQLDPFHSSVAVGVFGTELGGPEYPDADKADEAVKRIAERAYDHTPNYDK